MAITEENLKTLFAMMTELKTALDETKSAIIAELKVCPEERMQKKLKSDEKFVLNSVVGSSAAVSGSVDCDSVSRIVCSGSIEESGSLESCGELSETCAKESMCDSLLSDSETVSRIVCSGSIEESGSLENCEGLLKSCSRRSMSDSLSGDDRASGDSVSAVQDVNDISVNVSQEVESAELDVNNDNKSASMCFQNWRESLPKIAAGVADRLNSAKKKDSQPHLDDIWDSKLDLPSGCSLLRNMKTDDERSVEKGEPPPGVKLFPSPALLFKQLCMKF